MNENAGTSARRRYSEGLAGTARSIVVHVDDARTAPRRLDAARDAAEAFGAIEVQAVYATQPMLWRYPFALSCGSDAVATLKDIEDDQRGQVHAAVEAALASMPGLDWIDASGADPVWALAHRTMYADLVILGRPDPASAGDLVPRGFPASVIVAGGCQALVLPPPAHEITSIGRRVLVAWKETREAAHAVSSALPWLAQAEEVHAVAWQGADKSAGGLSALTRRLRRHGVEPVKHYEDGDPKDVGAGLVKLAHDVRADLIVMGCYGHGRAQEWVLGGTTRTMLEQCPLPMLMSH